MPASPCCRIWWLPSAWWPFFYIIGSINFSVRYWIDYPNEEIGYFQAVDAEVKAIKRAFDQEDILIPFPIRTLDFDAKGGLKLAESLQTVVDQRDKPGSGKNP